MITDSSATALSETPHETETLTIHETQTTTIPISDALKHRAQLVMSDISIDPEWRTIIRYALELDDPGLSDLIRRAEAGEDIVFFNPTLMS
jgi:hypothetical protein